MSINTKLPCILAIETSCDDTSVAIISGGKMLANITMNQHIHSKYGGVVPELASRNHEKNMLLTYKEALETANIILSEADAIAFTQGPGLLGSLLVGTSFAKSLALATNKPLIAIDHLQAHVAAAYIANPAPKFPFLCLLVSGGHTQIIRVTDYFQFEILGKTLDDAAGEAFDKIGKMLGLPYPAGQHIDKLAKQGNPDFVKFTYSKVPNFDYSFSGLKTQVLYYLQKQEKANPNFIAENLADLCAAVQNHIVTYLTQYLNKLLMQQEYYGIALVGGVSANSALRAKIASLAAQNHLELLIPDFEYCTDNAGMIAQAAIYKYQNQDFVGMDVVAKARF